MSKDERPGRPVVFRCRADDVPAPPYGLRFDAGDAGAAFLVRSPSGMRAYVNRCAHLELELDLVPGLFFCRHSRYLVCSTHGALFEPATGFCVAGPCAGSCLDRFVVDAGARWVSVRRAAAGAWSTPAAGRTIDSRQK